MSRADDLVRRFLDQGGVVAQVEHTMTLAGGYSGAAVVLAWIAGLPPIVLKVGGASEIEREYAGRQSSYQREQELKSLGLAHLGNEDAAGNAPSKCLAYMFEGGDSYLQVQRRVDFSGYLSSYAAGHVTRESLNECFRQVVLNTCGEQVREPRKTPLPLSQYLPPIDWPQTTNILQVVSQLLPGVANLNDFEGWFTERVKHITIAPLDDERRIHGDLWFANLLVDPVKSDVFIIDYGNSITGHAFQDLARFEIDLLLRTGSGNSVVSYEGRISSVRSAANALVPTDNVAIEALIPLAQWREALTSTSSIFSRPGAFEMYRWFLLVELMKRLRWVTPAASPTDMDAGTLLESLMIIQRSVDDTIPESLSVRAPGQLQAQLALKDVYLPVAGIERTINRVRNLRKSQALRSTIGPKSRARLVAETGHSYLHHRGVFSDDVRALLAGGGHIEVAHLDREFGIEYIRSHPTDSHANAPDFVRKHDEAVEGFEILREEFPFQISLKRLSNALAATILVAGDSLFYEPYLSSSKSRRPRVLFDTFEFELLPGGTHIAAALQDHVDFLISEGEAYD